MKTKIVSSGKALSSPEFLRRKKRNKRIKLCVITFLTVLFVGGVIYLFHNEKFLINGVKISGNSVVSGDAIAQLAQEKLKGSYLFILPRSNTLIYPRQGIKDTLLKEFPRLESVELSLEGLNVLEIEVSDREPAFIYCASECYFMDRDGLIFDIAPSFSAGVYLAYSLSTPIDDPVGKMLMDKESFITLSNFIEKLGDLEVHASKFEIGDDEYALVLHNGGEILWKKETSFDLVYSNLEAFLSSSAIKTEENFLDRISRLDLRTDNKVFYKFKTQ
jgi:cell division septal protein FtsQ